MRNNIEKLMKETENKSVLEIAESYQRDVEKNEELSKDVKDLDEEVYPYIQSILVL